MKRSGKTLHHGTKSSSIEKESFIVFMNGACGLSRQSFALKNFRSNEATTKCFRQNDTSAKRRENMRCQDSLLKACRNIFQNILTYDRWKAVTTWR